MTGVSGAGSRPVAVFWRRRESESELFGYVLLWVDEPTTQGHDRLRRPSSTSVPDRLRGASGAALLADPDPRLPNLRFAHKPAPVPAIQ
jgi:hypothetical protein